MPVACATSTHGGRVCPRLRRLSPRSRLLKKPSPLHASLKPSIHFAVAQHYLLRNVLMIMLNKTVMFQSIIVMFIKMLMFIFLCRGNVVRRCATLRKYSESIVAQWIRVLGAAVPHFAYLLTFVFIFNGDVLCTAFLMSKEFCIWKRFSLWLLVDIHLYSFN